MCTSRDGWRRGKKSKREKKKHLHRHAHSNMYVLIKLYEMMLIRAYLIVNLLFYEPVSGYKNIFVICIFWVNKSSTLASLKYIYIWTWIVTFFFNGIHRTYSIAFQSLIANSIRQENWQQQQIRVITCSWWVKHFKYINGKYNPKNKIKSQILRWTIIIHDITVVHFLW